MTLASQDLAELRRAKKLLEKPGLVVRVSGVIGAPVEKGLRALPGPLARFVGYLARKGIEKAFGTALYTLGDRPRGKPSNRGHKAAAMLSGAVGGAFGLPALFLELPLATTIMLRSIADIARSEGENLRDPETKMECIQVLALGGRGTGDDAAETGYFAVRAGLAKAVSDAAKHLAARQVTAKGAPVIARLISLVAARFSVVASKKLVAQAVPLLGAFGGATINALFIAHYQRMARGHFTVRRLEREFGTDAVRAAYAQL
ncbi:EcsC family protein [Thioalkalivibrio sp. XN8]|uniref:EcsC family protein n=1 Tax=Thioalkalivibrio sp. XN8 TaxID=2712863 RepID=UPI0013EA7E70|nr:EcsC family protein [Thioalkalivibrio sp. XN8]NGP52431.1 EcsC family protein [Thioalkalivibrio sp. XN8]